MNGFTVLYSGEGENLLTGAASRWGEAEQEHHASHLYTRLNISQSIRKHEHRDLIAGYNPLMNDDTPAAQKPQPPKEASRPTVSGGPEETRDRPEA